MKQNSNTPLTHRSCDGRGGSSPPQGAHQAKNTKVRPARGSITIDMLPVAVIALNKYNANELTAEEQKELLAEVRRLRRLPKPLVVRTVNERYEVVDGEHGLRAAKAARMTAVSCEIVDVDDFEAMRQNFARNRHGTSNPLKLARLFKSMMELRKMSYRALALALRISDGTVRNTLTYLDAYEVRSSCAPDTAESDIAKLSVRDVQRYVQLPAGTRDEWLDAGCPPVDAAANPGGNADHPLAAEEHPPAEAGGADEGDQPADQQGASSAPETPRHARTDRPKTGNPATGAEAGRSTPHVDATGSPEFKDIEHGLRSAADILLRNEDEFARVVPALANPERQRLAERLNEIGSAAKRMLNMLDAGGPGASGRTA